MKEFPEDLDRPEGFGWDMLDALVSVNWVYWAVIGFVVAMLLDRL
jgi:hypothetical protein